MDKHNEKAEEKNPHGLSKFGESVRELFLVMGLDVASNPHAKSKLQEMCKHVKDVNGWLLIGLVLRLGLWCSVALAVVNGLDGGDWWTVGGMVGAGIALDVQSFTVTVPGAAGTLMTAVVGDPANVRNALDNSRILLVGGWTKAQLAGNTIVAFPSGNDQTRNINWINAANTVTPKIPLGSLQIMRPQDLLSVTETGSVTAGDVELVSLAMFYEDLPGISSQLITAEALASRTVRLVTIRDTVTPTVASTYSGARALNAATGLLRANTQYAILGAEFNLTGCSFTVRGPDTGNLRCAIPCMLSQGWVTGRYFVDLADWYGLPLIPTFNSANVAGTFAEVLQDENLGAVPFSLMLAELTS